MPNLNTGVIDKFSHEFLFGIIDSVSKCIKPDQDKSYNSSSSLISALQDAFGKVEGCVVYSLHGDKQFGKFEFLYDLLVCEKGFSIESPVKKNNIDIIGVPMLALEAEFSSNSRDVVNDLVKLFVSAAYLKILIVSIPRNVQRYNQFLLNASKNCKGNFYVIYMEHPRYWKDGLTVKFFMWFREDYKMIHLSY
ncbi:hypothetical protein [Desulfocurvibacter africanus]|nr:hypothetical protein [Desulfocurvibacter africanus]